MKYDVVENGPSFTRLFDFFTIPYTCGSHRYGFGIESGCRLKIKEKYGVPDEMTEEIFYMVLNKMDKMRLEN
jgi:hypothetical protein